MKQPEGTSGSPDEIQMEVDKMLKEFSKLMPSDGTNPLDTDKPSSEQIENTFRKLLEEPFGNEFGDADLGDLNDMNKVIEQMMGELTSKEILYEPFAEMVQKVI